MRIVFASLFLLCESTIFAQSNIADMLSPDLSKRLVVYCESGCMEYEVFNGEDLLIGRSLLGISLNDNTQIGVNDDVTEVEESAHQGVISSRLSERAEQVDNYSQLVIKACNNGNDFVVTIRLYDEGLAIKYEVCGSCFVAMNSDNTTFDISAHNVQVYAETGTESGYFLKDADGETIKSLTPFFATCNDWSFTFNEAANDGIAEKASVICNNGIVSLVQKNNGGIQWSTPWRYVVWGKTPIEMIEGKYILRSLNEECSESADWIVPGKVFRSLSQDTNVFFTDSVAGAIDFAADMNFQYVLLDAGWYGLGYSYESSAASNPLQPVATFDIEETVNHARDKDIGIIAYVNQAAWYGYDNEQIINTYSDWGIQGVKMGFMDGLSEGGLKRIYTNARRAFDRQMLLNVHDNMRPTGVERALPNLMTTEGIRGDEHFREATFTSTHDMLLPFTRFMSGPADYTIIYPGYSDVPTTITQLRTTKGHQLALSVIYFSPLQHIFWYGKYWMYLTHPVETEFFKSLETVWDDYKIIDGEPGKYFTIARNSKDRWFLASATDAAERNKDIDLGFLDGGLYTATLYEDNGNNGISKRTVDNLTRQSCLTFSLASNGGCVAIIEKQEYATSMTDAVNNDLAVFPHGEEILLPDMASNVYIYSLNGSLISMLHNVETIPTVNLQHGIYIVRVVTSGKVIIRKIRI
ncbi:MAG: glycoside hydrolase family 97 catalytic domain-containing protein [Bacteroidales bacterium]|nr:glycoside hydrolase family 97 catalytic domain-containing protein [Bacteroidales bacterium]